MYVCMYVCMLFTANKTIRAVVASRVKRLRGRNIGKSPDVGPQRTAEMRRPLQAALRAWRSPSEAAWRARQWLPSPPPAPQSAAVQPARGPTRGAARSGRGAQARGTCNDQTPAGAAAECCRRAAAAALERWPSPRETRAHGRGCGSPKPMGRGACAQSAAFAAECVRPRGCTMLSMPPLSGLVLRPSSAPPPPHQQSRCKV